MLAPETSGLWEGLHDAPELSSFVLIGGSALALHVGHRVSEDLDFVTVDSRLPRRVLDRYLGSREERWDRRDDPVAHDEFLNAGMEPHDYQQDFIVDDAVKVIFFTADEPLGRALDGSTGARVGPRLATLDELFRSKAILSASRSRTRDWLDLYTLFSVHGYSASDYQAAFVRSGIPRQWEDGLGRRCSGRVPKSDEGYLHLSDKAPSLGEMVELFRRIRDEIERRSASNLGGLEAD